MIDLNRLESYAPAILANCEHLLEWFKSNNQSNNQGNETIFEELEQSIFLLRDAGVDSIDLNAPTDAELAELDQIAAQTELDAVEGNVITSDMVWDKVNETIANYKPKVKVK